MTDILQTASQNQFLNDQMNIKTFAICFPGGQVDNKLLLVQLMVRY